MENKDFIVEEEVLVEIWQYEDAPYRMVCYDGYAIGKLVDDVDAPATIRMEYPKLADVLSDMGGVADDILQYRGLWDKTVDDIHYGDIMMYLGEIVS